ncbi:MAG: DUF2007 domain-containing protein [Pseudomonadota bacterium]
MSRDFGLKGLAQSHRLTEPGDDRSARLWQILLMEELVRTNDMVMISVIESLFKEAEIIYMVADQNMSVLEGSIGLLPRRIMVVDSDKNRAIALLRNAGLGEELRMDVR